MIYFVLDLRKNKIYHLSDEDELDVTIHFVNTGEDSMTGARIARIKKYVENEEDFFMTYGDGVADIDICELYKFHKRNGKVATLAAVHPVYKFGLVEFEGESITKFDEKPNMKDFINGGFMVFNKKIFDYLSTDLNCILEQEPLRKLASEGQLAGFKHFGFWKCMDTQKEVDEFNKLLKDNPNGAPWEIWKTWKNKRNTGEELPRGDRLIISSSSSFTNGINDWKDKQLNKST
jgi:glucose-1-phosphate cytidylyltransferase